jgi:hypothetical protein|tara:strand:- start:304 stop:570 length:267 start_codon:yes stop_codon:yes gene_type:complete
MENGELIELTEEEIAEILADREQAELDLSGLRQTRNSLLQVSDWTQTADSPLSDEKKAEWATYRQELRDFPTTGTKRSDFGDFPTPPE